MKLTNKQKEILIGTVLGDACLEKNGNHVRLRIEHGMKQGDYIRWKYREFQNIATDKPRLVENYRVKNGKLYRYWHFSTYSNTIFDKYWKIFYSKKRKIIPFAISQFLKSPLSLAVWFMDDGYKRNDCNALRLSTDSFTKLEQKQLQRCLEQNFRIKTALHKKGNVWNIYIPKLATEKFCKIIRAYIIPSLKYKITLTP